ncbi:hypothetical protein [Methylophilus sp. TWE2]|uniref:hypothetical protein n=1 Tax=Methylophilus sp. TWE2 TaxID=1662285 RepID=UPI0006713F59|nr:hypothetical protein [Methylophilus sp. TWE2]AKR43177.1 hypothetical protein ACJ67_06870 [Methylophilus sp. TWE2]
MTDFAFYVSFLTTAISAVVVHVKTKKLIKSAAISPQQGKNKYLLLVLFFGVISGLVIFPSLVSLFNWLGVTSSYGHGEVLIAAPVFNFLFAIVLGILGRIVLTWEPIKW